MSEATGSDIAKILETKVVQRAYADGIAPAVKESGKIGKDIMRGLRLFTAPFRLMGNLSERLDRILERARKTVPPDQQAQSPANVAGPVLEKLRFIEDGSVLQEMFLSLLTASIDKRKQAEAHPAFPNIIGSFDDEEAFFFYDLAALHIIHDQVKDEHEPTEAAIRKHLPAWNHLTKDLIYSFLDHLDSLGLIKHQEIRKGGESIFKEANVWIGVTHFGEHFARICFPDKVRVEEVRKKPAEPAATPGKRRKKPSGEMYLEGVKLRGGAGSVGPGGDAKVKGDSGQEVTMIGGSIIGGNGGDGGGKGGDAGLQGGDGV